ncbi:MAG: hypothetical protein IPN78_10945 [Candidatus Accumulibacter sp.]|nr:hypothetical protein [Candidatus Accumulibacter propinquus]
MAGGAGDWGSLKRSFLFLQGVCSPFFASLADRLVADGYRVHKINFNAGDLLYWGARPAWNYRGDLSGLRDSWTRSGIGMASPIRYCLATGDDPSTGHRPRLVRRHSATSLKKATCALAG